MDKKNIVIVGGGGFMKCIINYIENDPLYNIVGYTDVTNNGEVLGVKYLGTDDVLPALYCSGVSYAAVGVGLRLNDSSLKRKITNKVIEIGYKIPTLLGKNVVIHRGVIIEDGAIIRDGAIIQSGVHLKSYCMIGDNVVVGHDSIVNSFAHVVMGSTVGRDCVIGEGTFIGYGSTILNGIIINSDILVGAKSLVNKDCQIKGTYFGIPAKRKE